MEYSETKEEYLEAEEERLRNEFLDHVELMCKYWHELEPRQVPEGEDDVKWRIEGVAFSILVALDGGAGGLPGYEVKPLTNEFGDEWTEDEPAPDIGGYLHELFRKERK